MSANTTLEPVANPRASLFRRLPVVSHFNKSVGLQRFMLVVGLVLTGIFLRLVRTNVIGTFNMPYIDAARSRGIREGRLVRTHAYRPALIPIITVIGLQIALLLGGAVLTETTFEWKGLGFQLTQYLLARDFVAVQGIVVLLAIIVAFTNFIVDVIAAFVDPRVRY